MAYSSTVYPPSPCRHQARTRGFTLIELLMVIAVIMLLAGLTFGISTGVRNAQARAEAKGELATLQQGLERFKSQHGDYPWVEEADLKSKKNAEILLEALMGWWHFEDGKFQPKEDVPDGGPEAFIDPGKFMLSEKLPDDRSTPPEDWEENTYIQDPWETAYVYLYKSDDNPDDWEAYGYHLFSAGPDGEVSTEGLDTSTGVMDSGDFRKAETNGDNVHQGD